MAGAAGDLPLAETVLGRALQLTARGPPLARAQALYARGNVQILRRQALEAEATYREVARLYQAELGDNIYPAMARLAHQLALVYAIQQREEETLTVLGARYCHRQQGIRAVELASGGDADRVCRGAGSQWYRRASNRAGRNRVGDLCAATLRFTGYAGHLHPAHSALRFRPVTSWIMPARPSTERWLASNRQTELYRPIYHPAWWRWPRLICTRKSGQCRASSAAGNRDL